jgi:hypothetical protein
MQEKQKEKQHAVKLMHDYEAMLDKEEEKRLQEW